MPKIVTYKQLGFSELSNNYTRSMLNQNSYNLRNGNNQKIPSGYSRFAQIETKNSIPLNSNVKNQLYTKNGI